LPEKRQGSPVGRAIWSGSISFGLVTVPIELFSAWRRGGVAFRSLGPSGAPLARQYVCPRDEKVLGGDEIERGYEVREGEYVTVTDEELERVAPGRSRDITLERFVPRDAIDPAFFARSHFLLPGGEQLKAYSLLAATMEESGRAAIARFVMRGKAYALAIFADRGILRAETLRFGDEVRSAKDVQLPEPDGVDEKVAAKMMARVKDLSATRLDESELRDDVVDHLVALARRKRERGEDVVEVPEGEAEAGAAEVSGGAEVVDLMALLKHRMKGGGVRKGARNGEEPGRDGHAGTGPRARGRGLGSLDRASKQELYERAQQLDVPGRSSMSREELLVAVRRAS
jgi:DNA end-binding protein Ku